MHAIALKIDLKQTSQTISIVFDTILRSMWHLLADLDRLYFVIEVQ